MVETLKPFQRAATYVANGPIECTLQSVAVRELQFNLHGGFASAAGVGTPSSAAPLPLVSQFAVEQFGQSLISGDTRSLYHLAAIYQGGYSPRRLDLTVNGKLMCRFSLPLHRMMDGAGIDAIASPIIVKGRWTTQNYLTGATAPTSVDATTTLEMSVVTAEGVPPGGFLRPNIYQRNFDISSASSSLPFTIDVKDDILCPGLLLIAEDANGGASTGDPAAPVDGLVRRVTVILEEPGVEKVTVVDSMYWGALRANHLKLFGGSNGGAGNTTSDETASTGCVFVPFIERRGGRFRDAVQISPNSTITVIVDTSSTPEGEITAVTPAAGDKLKVLVVGFGVRPGGAQELQPTRSAQAAQARTAIARGADARQVRARFLGR